MTSAIPENGSWERTWAVPPVGLTHTPTVSTMIVLAAGVLSSLHTTSAMAAGSALSFDPRYLVLSDRTNSGLQPEQIADAVDREERDADGRVFPDAVGEVRRRSGLTWDQLASLFQVDRRSVHLWASGRRMSASNTERLHQVLSVLRRGDRGSVSATREWLLTPAQDGQRPLDLLQKGRFEEIIIPSRTAVQPRPAPLAKEVQRARAPKPLVELVDALHDEVYPEKGKLIAAVPLKVPKPK